MKFKLKRQFSHQVSARRVEVIEPGIYSVPGDVSKEVYALIRKYGKSEILETEKKAPEDKVVKAPENKARVAKKSKRSRSAGAKSND